MNRTKIHRTATLALSALVLICVSLFAAAPAQASTGGGCGQPGGSGFSVKACVSVNGLSVIADAYATGSPGAGLSCFMYIYVDNESYQQIASSGQQGCTDGHHNGTSINELSGSYYGVACWQIDRGSTVVVWDCVYSLKVTR